MKRIVLNYSKDGESRLQNSGWKQGEKLSCQYAEKVLCARKRSRFKTGNEKEGLKIAASAKV